MSGAQVFRLGRVYPGVSAHSIESRLSEDVRCLNCRHVYSKPTLGTTARRNPGCPDCGYVGWLSVLIPVEPREPQGLYGPSAIA